VFLLEPAVKHFSQKELKIATLVFNFSTKISIKISTDFSSSGPPAKKPKPTKNDDCLQSLRNEESKSHARRDRVFQNGRAEGIKEGTKLGLAQGLAQGIKEGKLHVKQHRLKLQTRRCIIVLHKFSSNRTASPQDSWLPLRRQLNCWWKTIS